MSSPARRPLGVLEFCPQLWGSAAIGRRARVEIGAMRRAGHRVAVVTDATAGEAGADWPDVAVPPPHVVSAPGPMARRTAGKLVAFLVGSLRVLARTDWTAIDVVVSHTPVSVVAAWPWCRRRRARLVYVCHVPSVAGDARLPVEGSRARLPTRIVSGAADRIALRAADLVVCPSEPARAWHARVRRGKPTLRLPNPIDTSRFTPDPSVAKDIDVLFVGRLGPEKGAAVLLRAAAALERPRRIVVVGEGQERPLLERLARETSSEVELVGWLRNDELPGWYRRARVVAVPSYYESMGVSAAEAIASGTPVVASAVGGLLDVVHDGVNGWLVPPGDPLALAGALDDALRRDRAADLSLGSCELDDEQFAAEWLELLDRVGEEAQRMPESRSASR